MKQKKYLKQITGKQAIWILIRILIIIFFVFCAIATMGYHERWADEAQAWLLARDSSLTELIFFYASYEGSPMLWHLILKAAISLRSELFFIWHYSANSYRYRFDNS